MVNARAGVVSVILVNFDGAEDTIAACLSLRELDWPAERLEIVVVDNGSRGDDAQRIREAVPGIVLVEQDNRGFAGGCNSGVAASSGEFVAFLNNDARPDAGWVREAVAAFDDPGVAAVASRVLDAEGRLVDFIDAGMTWYGKAYKPFVGEVAGTLGLRPKDVLFGTGSAMFVRRDVFQELGGFDERFFMFYEDVDLGWRLNLRGMRFRYVPESVAYHRHHGSAGRFAAYKEQYLLDRNALFVLYKNVEDARIGDVLSGALALTVRRGVTAAGLDSGSLDYRASADDTVSTEIVERDGLAAFYAVDRFVEELPGLAADRERIQRERVRSDAQLWSLFGPVDGVAGDSPDYRAGYAAIVRALPVTDPARERRVVVVTGDPIGPLLAGPAIRAVAIATALSAHNHVDLVTMSRLETFDAPFALHRIPAGDDRAFRALEQTADVIIFQGHAMSAFESLRSSDKILVVDVYDPMHLEQLEQGRELPYATWSRQVDDATGVLNEQLARGDFFLCASERQRQFYLGQLAGLGRINPDTYANDPDLERLIAVVPFGLPSDPPRHESDVLRGVVPGIGPADRLLIWGGGLYNWFDPETLVRAVAVLSERHDDVRLFFQGTKHPNPDVPEMAIVATTRDLARELGVLGSSVFLNDEWVPFDQRQNYLLEADAGVSTHLQHIETTFSFRTRILDYLWAGLPMVVTDGDSFADLVRREDLGVVVPDRDVDALASALEDVLYDSDRRERWRANVARVREEFYWERTLAPLVGFVDAPARAADSSIVRSPVRRAAPPRGLRRDLGLAIHHLRHGGPQVLVRKIRRRLSR